MERIYSVEEIASILKLQPFTVRKMFREKKLSGFKLGKAWRITESRLQAYVVQLEESSEFVAWHDPSSADIPDKSQSPVDGELRDPSPRAALQKAGAPSYADIPDESQSPVDGELRDPSPRPALQKAGAPSYRSLLPMTGSLLIFSETPGEEVYLDGESQGQTTLSLLNVAGGEHRLQVGDVIDTIMVLPDIEMRVRSAGGVLNVTTRSSTLEWWAPAREEIDAKLVVQMENHSKMSGVLLVLLAGENAEATRRIFGDYEFANYENETSMTNIQLADARALNKDIVEDKVQLSGTLVRNESAVLFDGPIIYVEGDHLEVTIPKQPGIGKQICQTFPLTGDLSINLSIAAGGMLRGRPTVRIELEK